jgi:hypothetical protein
LVDDEFDVEEDNVVDIQRTDLEMKTRGGQELPMD